MVMIKFGKKGLSRIIVLIALAVILGLFLSGSISLVPSKYYPQGYNSIVILLGIFLLSLGIFFIFRLLFKKYSSFKISNSDNLLIFSLLICLGLFSLIFVSFPSIIISYLDFLSDFISPLNNFIRYESALRIGLAVGLILWAFYFIYATYQQLIDWIKDKTPGTGDGEVICENKNEWLKFIAGRIWKIPLIGIAYLTLKTIPFVKNVVEIITLEIFGASGWLLILIICIELGFGPAFYEWWKLTKFKTKVNKKVSAIKTAAELDRIKAKVD